MNNTKNINIVIRLASMLLDHFIMTFIMAFLGVILFGISYLVTGGNTIEEAPNWFAITPFLLGVIIFSIYFNKDAIKGKSPAKRILGLVVVNDKTGKIANPIKAVIRNITLVLWPLEVVFSMFSPERRMGDYIAGTRVIIDDKTLKSEIKISQIIIALFLGLIYMLIILALQFLILGISNQY